MDLVSRRFDRARYDGERTASDFSEQLRDEVDIDHLTIALATTAAGVAITVSPISFRASCSNVRPALSTITSPPSAAM